MAMFGARAAAQVNKNKTAIHELYAHLLPIIYQELVGFYRAHKRLLTTPTGPQIRDDVPITRRRPPVDKLTAAVVV